MDYFSLKLSNGATITGLKSLPQQKSDFLSFIPLIVGIHGGTYSSTYFDATPSTSAVNISRALMVPFIAIDRPGYLGSTPLDATRPHSSYLRDEGKYLHTYILPAIWAQFGQPNQFSTMVLLAHSLGTGAALVASSMYSSLEVSERSYRLGGFVCSGLGTVPTAPLDQLRALFAARPQSFRLPISEKNIATLGPADELLTEPFIYNINEQLDQPMLLEELQDVHADHDGWFSYWKSYSQKITIPVMYGLAEKDSWWLASKDTVQAFADAFPSSPRVERGIILGAPHCEVLGRIGVGWLTRAFGFAIECAVREGISEELCRQ